MSKRSLRPLALLLCAPIIVILAIWGMLAIAGARLTHLLDPGGKPVPQVRVASLPEHSVLIWGTDTVASLQRVRVIYQKPVPYEQYEATFRDSAAAARVIADTTIAAVKERADYDLPEVVVLRIVPQAGYKQQIQRGSVTLVPLGKYLSLY
jgi:hypothetical protein